MSSIQFANQHCPFSLPKKRSVAKWLTLVAHREGYIIGELTYIFCSDDGLLDINNRFLNHDYYTDVITFDYSVETMAAGDIFISIDRVSENAQEYGVPFIDEVHRVLVHGLLHLIGYKDDSDKAKNEMRGLEDLYLSLRTF